MKDGVREGLHIKCKKEEKEFVTAEEERKFWEMNLLQGRNMVYGLRARSPKYDWDRGSEERAQGSEEGDQGLQGFWARTMDQIYYTV